MAAEFASRTVFQHFFNVSKALFVVGYLILLMKDGIISTTYKISGLDLNLVIDLRLFIGIVMLLSLLGLAKSVFQTINFLDEKENSIHLSSLNLKA